MSDNQVVPATKLRTVIAASAAGTAFEWYDFFIFGALASIISRQFFTGVSESAGFVFALATFAVGFAVRPLGAMVFGWFGDRNGRKGAFLVTIVLMGAATVAIGLLPTYQQAGLVGPILLIVCRVLQGFALGGEYGGAAIYVAEHAPKNGRGAATAWIQTSAALGLLGAVGVVLITRMMVTEAAFQDWGWRIPFLVSAGLLLISVWMRTKLGESPAFKRMEAAGTSTKTPLSEVFLVPANLRTVLLVLIGLMIAQGAVWYTTFFYSQFFLERVLKVDPRTVNLMMLALTLASAGLYVFFGWLSDRVGRKPVMLFGMGLALLAFFPVYQGLTPAMNPSLARAEQRAPVFVSAAPGSCGIQFDPLGVGERLSSCDRAKAFLASAGVPYSTRSTSVGAGVRLEVGSETLVLPEIDAGDAASTGEVDRQEAGLAALLESGGYPTVADPKQVDFIKGFGLLMALVLAATALYGPQAAALVELFPTRIRYTGMSVPYNIGNGWVGGFLPATAFAIVAATGDVYSGLWYPFGFTLVAFVTTLLFLPETRSRDLDAI